MAKATTTIRQILNYKPERGAWFAPFNQVVAFYFSVIQAHERALELGNREARVALEKLTHATEKNRHPVMPLSAIAQNIPTVFRRAAINAALGSARFFYSLLKKWRVRKEKALAKGKKFTDCPPVPPRSWNKSVTIYAEQWKERTDKSIMLKLWTGTCWSWVKCRITGRELPDGVKLGSPQLVRHGKEWRLHTPVERQFASPAKAEEQVTTNAQAKICAVDLNNADRNASIKIGQRLIARYQPAPKQEKQPEEKPQAPQLRAERSAQVEGVTGSQDAGGEESPSMAPAGHGTGNGRGTARKGKLRRMGSPSLSIPTQLRLPME